MLVRPEIDSLPRYRPGRASADEIRQLGLERIVKLNSNEAPWPPFPEAIEAMQRTLPELNRYPDTSYRELREALGEQYGVDPARIVVGNGSGSLIRLLALVLFRAGDEVLIPWPPYPAHVVSASLMGAAVVRVPLVNGAPDLEALLGLVTPRTRLAYICSPHNPTGTVLRQRQVDDYLASVPEHVVTVLDQAYQEFVTDLDAVDGRACLDRGKPVVVFRTFSKVYGLAGLRVGYSFASPELSEPMQRAQESFTVSRLGVQAALASLQRQDLVRERTQANAVERRRLKDAFAELGLDSPPTEANFVFVDTRRDAKAVSAAMLRRGVMIRSGEVHDAPTWVRVTVGSPDDNGTFLAAFGEALTEVAPLS